MAPSLIWSPTLLDTWGMSADEPELDLDIRVIAYPSETSPAHGGSDYLTCKTDSTCDDSNAC